MANAWRKLFSKHENIRAYSLLFPALILVTLVMASPLLLMLVTSFHTQVSMMEIDNTLTLDRYAEIAVLSGIIVFYLFNAEDRDLSAYIVLAGVLAISGSLMVSYVRARAEGLGQKCTVGLMQRPERIICLGLGAFLGEPYLPIALVLIAVVSNITAISRLFYISKNTKS